MSKAVSVYQVSLFEWFDVTGCASKDALSHSVPPNTQYPSNPFPTLSLLQSFPLASYPTFKTTRWLSHSLQSGEYSLGHFLVGTEVRPTTCNDGCYGPGCTAAEEQDESSANSEAQTQTEAPTLTAETQT